MNPHNSSTSSSEPGNGVVGGTSGEMEAPAARPGGDLREALIVAAWTVLFLVAGDVAVNRLFPLPRDPRVAPKGRLQVYFNYGWSIEAKIRRAVGNTDETSSLLALAGWVDRAVEGSSPDPNVSSDDLLISCYGMSFSNDIATEMARLDSRIRLRLFGGPAAPPNHSYATYELDRGGRSRVVILGVLGSSVQGLVTNNGMTWRFEGPAPFTYPLYFPRAAGLEAEWPMVRTLDDLRLRLSDRSLWQEYVSQLRATDAFYNEFLFRHNISDHSTLFRMIRRSMAQSWQSSRLARIHGPSGFVPESPVVSSLQEIIAGFAASARREGKLPVALLIHDQGYRDHIYRALEPVLSRDRIPFLSTHTLCPDTDPRNFVPDGHFTEEAYKKISSSLLALIHHELGDHKG
jgi:hypothetical protein